MSDVSISIAYEQRHLSLLGRVVFLAICGLSAAVFWYYGWSAVGPHDPLGPVSLFSHAHPFFGWLQTIVLTSLVSAMATLLMGKKMPHIGPFAAGVGLVALSTRGGTATYLLFSRAVTAQQSKLPFTFGLIAESLAWFIALAAAMIVAELVSRSVLGMPPSFPGFETEPRRAGRTNSPLLPNKILTSKPINNELATQLMPHLLHVMICTVTAVAAIVIFSSGYRSRGVEHGQACFIAAAGVGLGTYIAHRVQPVSSGAWSLLAIAPIAVVGYAWTLFSRVNAELPLPVLTSPFLSLLPIQLIGAGVLGSVWVIWYRSSQQTEEH